MKLLLWLYPRRWRRRYLREMEAVLEHEPWSLAVCADLLRGALDARLVLRRGRGQRASVRGPFWVALALAGGVALVVATGRLAGAHGAIVAGVVLGLVAVGAMLRRLGRPPRGRRADDGDGDRGHGAPVPRKPLPGGPGLAAAALRAIRGRRRPAASEEVHEEVEPEYQETIRQRVGA
jgi:hypothetical protein